MRLDTHIQLIHSRVGIPQGRGKVEPFYGTVTTELLPHLPGHIPHGTNGNPVTKPAPTLEQLDSIMERFIVTEYNQRQHSETGQTPADRWSASGFIPRSPAHPEDLDLLLLTAATTRRIQRDGIQFASTRYASPVIAAYVGEDVTVRYNPRDVAEIRVYWQDTFRCREIAPELAADSVSVEELRQARVTRRPALKQQLQDRRSVADALPADIRHAPIDHPTELADAKPAPHKPAPPEHGLRRYETD